MNGQDVFAVLFGRPADEVEDAEVRAEGREYLEVPLAVHELDQPANRGWVHNISEHGLGLLGVDAKVNEKKKLVITADEEMKIPPCEVEAVCRWVKKQGLDEEMDVGFEIINISGENWTKLLQMVPALEVDEKLRKEERMFMDPPLAIYDTGSPEAQGLVLDWSEHGLRITGIKASVGETKKFTLDPVYGSEAHGIEFEAVCRWTKPKDLEADFDSGFEITGVFGESFTTLLTLIPKPPLGSDV